ncbi:pilus assembly protein, partial [Achromobacter sp. Marseille-Q0513]|nr:pilus assembly protein [Achromobacter sp. Marseille-Q0513]
PRSTPPRPRAEPQAEALSRLYVIPVKTMQVDGAPKEKITAPMSVAIGYGVLVRHVPPAAKQVASWTHRCADGGMVLENTGNVRVVLPEATSAARAAPQALALFPGVPQRIEGGTLQWKDGGESRSLACR